MDVINDDKINHLKQLSQISRKLKECHPLLKGNIHIFNGEVSTCQVIHLVPINIQFQNMEKLALTDIQQNGTKKFLQSIFHFLSINPHT